MIKLHLIEGGIYFMLPIYIMWIVVLFFTIRFLLNYFSENKNTEKLKKQNSTILFVGSFAFLFGIFGQIIGFFQILDFISREGSVAPSIIAGGLKISLLAPLYGFVLLLISSLIWFSFKNLLSK